MDNSVKIIRLHSGEDIIATVTEHREDESVILNNPVVVIFKRLPTGRAIMMMVPWLPIELIKHNTATIYISDILTFIEPKDSVIPYYNTVVAEAQEIMNEPDSSVEEALQSGRNDVQSVSSPYSGNYSSSKEEDTDTEEFISSMQQSMEPKKRLLH